MKQNLAAKDWQTQPIGEKPGEKPGVASLRARPQHLLMPQLCRRYLLRKTNQGASGNSSEHARCANNKNGYTPGRLTAPSNTLSLSTHEKAEIRRVPPRRIGADVCDGDASDPQRVCRNRTLWMSVRNPTAQENDSLQRNGLDARANLARDGLLVLAAVPEIARKISRAKRPARHRDGLR